jgi:hypothetical protein
MDWIELAQDKEQWKALVNMVINLRVANNVVKFLNGFTIGGFTRKAQFHDVS